MEQLIQQHHPLFTLPLRQRQLTITEAKSHLNTAKKHLQTCQKDSVDIRLRSYLDLMAGYVNDKDPSTKDESARKATIVHNTIRSERSRAMHQNIRQVVKPETRGSLSTTIAPRH